MTTARDLPEVQSGSGWQFRFAGFAVSVPWNALLGIAVIALLWYPEFSGSTTAVGQWALAALFAVLLMVSILIHELAHAFAARAFRYPVAGITLWAMGGFTTYRTTTRHGPLREAAIALAGPLATLVIAWIARTAAVAVGPGIAGDVLVALASANFLVGLFNLLPGSPLDGGSVVKAIVWGITGSPVTGQVVAAWVGRLLAIVIVVSPFALALQVGQPPSLMLIIVGVVLAMLLWTGATASLRGARAARLLGRVAADEMARDIIPVTAATTVAQVLSVIRPDAHVVVVGTDGRPLGVVSEAAAAAVPQADRTRVTAHAVAVNISDGAPSLPASASAQQVVDACQETGSRFVFVTGVDGPPRIIDTDAAFVTEGP